MLAPYILQLPSIYRVQKPLGHMQHMLHARVLNRKLRPICLWLMLAGTRIEGPLSEVNFQIEQLCKYWRFVYRDDGFEGPALQVASASNFNTISHCSYKS